MNKLTGEYLVTYKKIRKQVLRKTKKNSRRGEVLLDLLNMFYSMQENRESLDDINERIDEYTREIVDNLELKKYPNLQKYFFITFLILSFSITFIVTILLNQAKPLDIPVVSLDDRYPNRVTWEEISNASTYTIYIDNKEITTTDTNYYDIQLKDYDQNHVIQVKANSNHKKYKNSKMSLPLLYRVPSQLVGEISQSVDGSLRYLDLHLGMSQVDIFGEVFFKFTPLYDSIYRLKLIDHKNTSHSFTVHQQNQNNKNEVQSIGKSNDGYYSYFLKEGTTYYISASNLTWKERMDLLLDPQPMDANNSITVTVQPNSQYVVRLTELEKRIYNFYSHHPSIDIHVLGHDYEVLVNSSKGFVRMVDITEESYDGTFTYPKPYYLLISNTSDQIIKTTITDSEIISIPRSEEVQFTASGKRLIYVYEVDPDITHYSIEYISDGDLFVTLFSEEIKGIPADVKSNNDKMIMGFTLKDSQKIYIIIDPIDQTVNGSFILK